jgi:hypothetical protein
MQRSADIDPRIEKISIEEVELEARCLAGFGGLSQTHSFARTVQNAS